LRGNNFGTRAAQIKQITAITLSQQTKLNKKLYVNNLYNILVQLLLLDKAVSEKKIFRQIAATHLNENEPIQYTTNIQLKAKSHLAVLHAP